MSIALQTEVWRLELPANQMLVALALADHGQDDGSHIYPSVDQIAWKTGYSVRQVQAILRRLEKSGLLIAVFSGGGRGRVTVYRMDTSAIPEKPPRQYGANIAPIISNTVQSSHPSDDTVQSSHPSDGDTVQSSHRSGETVQFATETVQFATETVQFATNRSIGNHHRTIREPTHARTKANGVTTEADTDPPLLRGTPPVMPEIPEGWRGPGLTSAMAWARSSYGRKYLHALGKNPTGSGVNADFRTSDVMAGFRRWRSEQGLD